MIGPRIGAAVFALVAALSACEAEERMRATLGQPALVTARHVNAPVNAASPRRVVVTIVAFTPPPDKKPVEIVVTASARGASHELGRVAVTPYASFGPADTARHKTFAFALPPDLTTDAVDVSVALAPVQGGGEGASLNVGSATIR
jgi:hypothetical protein